MTIYYIYKIVFLCGSLKNHYYIGKRCSHLPKYISSQLNIENYIREFPDFDNYTGSGTIPKSYFMKYDKILGVTYTKEIIEFSSCNDENMLKEKIYIGDLYKYDPLCENLQQGGNFNPILYKENNASYTKHVPDDVRQKISATLKQYYKTHTQKWAGISRSEETRKKLSNIITEYYKNRPGTFTGKTHTEQSKQKNSKSHIKLWENTEYRKKVSDGHIRYFNTHPGNKMGTHLTDEQKQHLSNINKGKPNYKNRGEKNGMFGKKPANCKKIYQYDKDWNYIKTWNSIQDAAKYYNLSNTGNFIKVCKGERQFVVGFRWSYELINN